MDAELKAKWVKALRSGAYKQIRNLLKTDQGHCCLGVLCEIQGANFETLDPLFVRLGPYDAGTTPEQCSLLARMNDGDCEYPPKSFSEIADYIEANL